MSDPLAEIREMLQMTAAQTAENAKQLGVYAAEHDREMKQIREEARKGRAEHDREMKEIRALFKKMLERIAV